ncbi:MAG: hypothetical protein AAF629_25820 [Chloroflexota bacterium]
MKLMTHPLNKILIVVIAAVMLFIVTLVATSWAAECQGADPCPPKKYANQATIYKYPLRFEAKNQSMWGPGPANTLPGRTIDLVGPYSWNEIIDFAYPDMAFAGQNSHPLKIEAVCTTTSVRNQPERVNEAAILSVKGNGHISGTFGVSARFYDFTSGAINIDYPLDVEIIQEGNFGPGMTVNLSSSWQPQTNAVLSSQPPRGKIDLDVTYALSTALKAEACAAGFCGETDFSPPLPLDIPVTTNTILTVDSVESIVLNDILGFSGKVGLPNVQTTSTLNSRNLIASETHHNFVDITGDIDAWLSPLVGIPLELAPEITDPIFGITVAEAELSLLAADLNLKLSQFQSFTFAPNVKLTLQFPQPVQYTIWDGNQQLRSDTDIVVTIDADHHLSLTLPPTFPQNYTPSPKFSFENQFSNETVTTITPELILKLIELWARAIGLGTVNCGPAYDISDPLPPFLQRDAPPPWEMQGNFYIHRVYVPTIVK